MYFHMKYDSPTNQYIIKDLEELKGIDRKKMNDGVVKYGPNIWVGKNKKELADFAEEHAKELIDGYTKTIEKINKRTVLFDSKGDKWGKKKNSKEK